MKTPPNILLVTSDQQHWSTLGVLNPAIRTPHLDRLAEQGMLFTRAYCPNPTCTPSRASILTGRSPSQHGAYSLGTRLDEAVPTVGSAFQRSGYDVSLIGKAHLQPLASTERHPSLESYPLLQDLDFWRTFHGPFYGFNHVELARNHTDEAHVGQHYALWLQEKAGDAWREWFRPPTGTTDPQYGRWNIPPGLHYNKWIVERSRERMARCSRQRQPFFLWASFFDPHPSYLVPEPWDTLYHPEEMRVPELRPGEHDRNPEHFRLTQERSPDFSRWREPDGALIHGFHSHLSTREQRAADMALYYGMVSCLDDAIGTLLADLESTGCAENTVVVFTSDHGHLFGQHGMTAKGAFHYEDLLRVPMMVRWPGRTPEGVQSAALQSLVDLAPTFLSLAGLELDPWMTGVDQSAVWQGGAEPARDHVLVENRHQPTRLNLHTFLNGQYKITVYAGTGEGELFDLANDPQEHENLWNDAGSAGLKSMLLHRLVQAEMANEPVPMPRISAA